MKDDHSVFYLVGLMCGVVLLGCGDTGADASDTSADAAQQDTANGDLPAAGLDTPHIAIDAELEDTGTDDATSLDVADTESLDAVADAEDAAASDDAADTVLALDVGETPDTADLDGTKDTSTDDVADVSDTTVSDVDIADAGDTQPPAPLESSFTPRPNPTNPWSSFAHVTLSRAARLSASVALEGTVDWKVIPTSDTASTDHELVVLGLQPGSAYTVHLELLAEGEAPVVEQHRLSIPGVNDGYPQLELVTSTPAAMSPGFTVFNPIGARQGVPRGQVFMVDASGAIVWNYGRTREIFCARPMDDGTFLLLGGGRITRIDRAGNTLFELDAQDDMGLDSAHHDVYAMPDGTFAVMTTELRVIDGYPDTTSGGTTQNVVGDVLVQFNSDGQILREIRLLDLLDPHRYKTGFLSGFWNSTYRDFVPTRDWSHTNAITYDPEEDTFVLSLRHHDWLVKIDAATGTLIWKLGEDGDFNLVGTGSWFYHQHAHTFADNGHVLMFDNGLGRPTRGAPFSRAVEYAFDNSDPDPANWSAEQVWEWIDDTPFFSSIYGDVDVLANGNILILDGSRSVSGERFARVVEVSHETPATKVFELKISHPVTPYSAYRAQRVPGGLYPDALLVPPSTGP